MLIYRYFVELSSSHAQQNVILMKSNLCAMNIRACMVCDLRIANKRMLDSNVIDELYANFVWRRNVNNVTIEWETRKFAKPYNDDRELFQQQQQKEERNKRYLEFKHFIFRARSLTYFCY